MNRSVQLLSECCRTVAPPPKQSLSEWAEENFVLSPEYSAATGKLTLYKFQREILDSFTDPYVRETVVMSATQLVKTLLQQVAIAYVISRDPGPILAAQPTETDAETFSKERLAPMIRDMECLHGRISEAKKGKGDNTTLHKIFPGGSLSLIGSQTAGNFARRSIRYFFADERDKWPKNVGKEGDGYSLGVKRQATFRSRAKRVQTCSPTIEGDSQIADAYAGSDQRKFWVPCPACGEHQTLKWAQVVWDVDALPLADNVKGKVKLAGQAARYKCEHCGATWDDVERHEACERGEWRAEQPFAGIAGFWISELYSPWKKLSEIVADFLAKKDNPVEFQTFVNTSLAETWKQQGDAPDWERLMSRCEEYRLGQVPPGVLFLTAGTDVQKTWLEGYVWGWGRGKQRWLIDHYMIEGDPYSAAVWPMLTDQLNTTYRHPGGADLAIVRMGVDTGFATQEVYAWGRQQGAGRVLAVDGRSSGASLVSSPTQVDVTISGRRIAHGCRLWPVNVSLAKSELYGLLNLPRPEPGQAYPAGWVHFPKDLDEECFKQLTAEQLVARVVKGYRKFEWQKTRERNEALDAANYARAAAAVFGMDRFSERRWAELEAALGQPARPEPEQTVAHPAPAAPRVEQAAAPTARDPFYQSQRGAGWLGDRTRNWFGR